MSAHDYNRKMLDSGELDVVHITELVKIAQRSALAVPVDGMFGPQTRAALERFAEIAAEVEELTINDGWLQGRTGLKWIKSNDSWYGGKLRAGKPEAIVAHYTATDGGTGVRMGETRRDRQRDSFDKPPGSWHVSIEADGTIIQQIALDVVAYHAGAKTAKPIPGLVGANLCSVGIELVGHGRAFPERQVRAAERVWRALVKHYGIPRELAMVQHSELDPTRRNDPGPVWMSKHATRVLDSAYK